MLWLQRRAERGGRRARRRFGAHREAGGVMVMYYGHGVEVWEPKLDDDSLIIDVIVGDCDCGCDCVSDKR